MSCSKTKLLMGPYMFDDLSAEEEHAVRCHTIECPQCREDLRDRIKICSELEDKVPNLSEEEISRIKWYVKGAVSDINKTRPSLLTVMIPAVSMSLFLGLGFLFGRYAGVMHRPPVHQSVQSAQPLPAQPERTADKSNDKKESVPAAENKSKKTVATDTDKGSTDTPVAADYFRSWANSARDVNSAGIATARQGRSGKHHRIIVLDQPLPLLSEPETKTPEVIPDENKLPEPSTLNSVEKLPSKPKD